MSRKHIAIDARVISSSTGRYVERLLHYLQEVDTTNNYTVLVRKKDLKYWKPTAKNFRVREADFDNYSLAEQFKFNRLLKKLQPDLVHFCMPQQPIFYRGKSVTTFHDLTLLKTWNTDKNWFIYHFKQFVGRFVFHRAIKKNSFILSPSEYTKKELLEFHPTDQSRIVVTPEAAETTAIKPKTYKLPFDKYIMYVGQQPNYKNIRRLMESHQRLLDRFPDLGLVLVGKIAADTAANKSWAESKGFKNIYFTGFVDDNELAWLFGNCRAYVFPSLMEGFGLPALEAMGQGAPVIASNATSIPEVCGDAAYYFDPISVDDMTEAIFNVLSDHGLRAKLIRRGTKRVKQFSWKRMAKQTHAVYLKALKK